MSMFSFFDMEGTYEDRVVGRLEEDGLLVSTAEVSDSLHPYETAVSHAEFNEGKLVIVEEYDSKDEAREGHKRWVEAMTGEVLPDKLSDVSGCGIASFVKALESEDCSTHWRKGYRQQLAESKAKPLS